MLHLGTNALDLDERLGTPTEDELDVHGNAPARKAHPNGTSTSRVRAPGLSLRKSTEMVRSSGSVST